MNAGYQHNLADFWLPDLCNALAFLRLILLGISIAITLTLLREGLSGFDLESIGRLFLYSVWIVFTSAVGLCQLRRWGYKLTIPISVSLAVLWLLLASGLCSLAAYQFIRPSMPISMAPMFLSNTTSTTLFSLWSETTLVTIVLGCFTLRFLFVHHELQNQQRQLMQAKYDALQARIKPHFLFNSLNSIAALIGLDADKAENAVLNLSDLLRMTMGEKDVHSLKSELDLCDKYLEIEKLRMGERMLVHMSVNPEVLSLAIPTLSIQPLLENAVLHGLQQLTKGGEIKVNIDFLKASSNNNESNSQNSLVIEIENPVPETSGKSRGTGSAFDNIKTRLQQFYTSKVFVEFSNENDVFLVKIRVNNPSQNNSKH